MFYLYNADKTFLSTYLLPGRKLVYTAKCAFIDLVWNASTEFHFHLYTSRLARHSEVEGIYYKGNTIIFHYICYTY